MNQRNVDALEKAMRGGMGNQFQGSVSLREVAELMASRGCLGPASEVLTEEQTGRMQEGWDSITFRDELERIAKGET